MTTPTAIGAVEPGTAADYGALARHHYRAARPATIARDAEGRPWVRVVREQGRPIAVMTVSMPTLNGAWRDLAWPGRFRGRRRDAAERLNQEVRCISRVIVHPHRRGQGLATLLVRTYLDAPATPLTEALASMGRYCALFEAAGMTAYPLPPTARDARLIDALASAGAEAWELMDAVRRRRLLRRRPWIAREARVWANASRGTRSLLTLPDDALVASAAARVSCRPVAYAHGGPSMHAEPPAQPERTRPPAQPPDVRDLPHPVTFFMTGRERSQVLRALRRLDGERTFALKRALGLA